MQADGQLVLRVNDLDVKVNDLSTKVDIYHQEVLDAIAKKKKKKSEEGDENEERGNWGHPVEFFLSCLGYAVGLGNVWRFPYICYKNGGGAFFIPYVIMLVIVGIPIFFMELSLGQFSSSGPATAWRLVPISRGIGLAMVIVSFLVAIYYNMILGWSFYYLFASFTSELPWTTCGDWSSQYCIDKAPLVNYTYCNETANLIPTVNGTCVYTNNTFFGFWNESLSMKTMGIKRVLPSAEYLNNIVLGKTYSDGIGDLGPIRWQLCLCYLLAWVFIVLALSKGVKSSGKVVYVTATFPYLVLVILLIRGLLLEGYQKGIQFYITPDLQRLADARVWKDAAVQIFFSLSASWGGLITLASYNRFHTDALRDSLIVSLGNCLTSVFAGFVIFSYLGFLSNETGIPVDEIADKGSTLAFVIYPFAVTKMPVSPLWAILFFIMLLTLGVDSQFVLVETVSTAVMDIMPRFRKYKAFVVMICCIIMFFLGLTLTTNGGSYMLDLMDEYSGGWNVLLIALCECITVCYIYGIKRFLTDIETMVGQKVCCIFPWPCCKFWWAACWCVLTPLGVTFVLVFSWYDYTRLDGYPAWADALGWGMTLVVVLAIFIPGIVIACCCQGPGGFKSVLRPTRDWGPASVKHRELVARYVPNFVVDPKGEQSYSVLSPNSANSLSKSSYPMTDIKSEYVNDGHPGYARSGDRYHHRF